MANLKWIIMLALIVLFGIIIFASGQTPIQRRVTCVIKTVNGTWSVLDNDYHDNEGCGTVTQTSTYIQIPYTAFDTVVGNSAEEDGTLLNANILAGGSIGLSYAQIAFLQNGDTINPNTITNAAANIFFEVVGNDN